MRRRVERFRRLEQGARRDYAVGCIVLQRVFFFDEADWIPVPADYSKHVGQGKTYDTSAAEGHALWEAVRQRLQASQPGGGGESHQGEMFGEPTLVQPHLGAGAFRLLITDLYRRRCAISSDDLLPVLESTHIRPVSEGGLHRVDNGLLLRSDLRRLFDHGYLSVDSSYRVLVSAALAKDFSAGRAHGELAGRELLRPARPEHHPRREFLDWHRAKVFRG
jgi:putative restriction endonuclease